MEIQKSQIIRLIDIWLFGPAIIYTSVRAKSIHPLLKLALFYAGASTIYYNGRNYLDNQKLIKQKKIIRFDIAREIEL